MRSSSTTASDRASTQRTSGAASSERTYALPIVLRIGLPLAARRAAAGLGPECEGEGVDRKDPPETGREAAAAAEATGRCRCDAVEAGAELPAVARAYRELPGLLRTLL